jgi:hypothetical protein
MGKEYKSFKGFLNDEQKLKHYMEMAGHNRNVYRHQAFLKIYEGCEILLYHYDNDGDLMLDTVLVCSGFLLTEKRAQATFIDRTNFKLITIGDLPFKVSDHNILLSMPVRCLVERTIKITSNGSVLQGMTSALLAQTKSNPDRKIIGHMQAVNLTQVHKRFTHKEFNDAQQRTALAAEEG